MSERPPSLLTRNTIDGQSVGVGLAVVVGAHGILPGSFLVITWAMTALGLAVAPEDRERAINEDRVIAAEFVKLGKEFDPRKRPNRKVPQKMKRVSDKVQVSKNMDPPKPQKKEKKKSKALDDLLDNLVDREKDFAEDVEREQEGNPDGIEGGTALEAKAGDIYRGKLIIFFRRGWEVPVTVQGTDSMKAVAAITIDASGFVRAVRINRSSGNPDFDHSVVERVENLIRSGAKIPEPPPGMEGEFYGVTRSFQFHGKHAQ